MSDAKLHKNPEAHVLSRIGWLRAAVLGANDGIVSVGALVAGVAASSADKNTIFLTGIAALVAGALSMAAGEYVSVSSQADSENAEIAREKHELNDDPEAEKAELAGIYVDRGLTPDLARQVAEQLTAKDALNAHARDELGISEITIARPTQASMASAAAFTVGALMPLAAMYLSPRPYMVWTVSGASLLFLAVLGWMGAMAGGSPALRPVIRVTFWGALALAVTAGIGKLVGTAV